MLSLLRWFVGCWHRWEKWKSFIGKDGYAMQDRCCEKCGVRQVRDVIR